MKKREIMLISGALLFSAITMLYKPPELLVLNLSASVPRGIYRLSSVPPAAGDYIVIEARCLAFTITNSRLIKKIVYCGNEEFRLQRDGLHIAGAVLKKSRDIGLEYEGSLRDDEFIILGDHARSFDSRYFGPVKRSDCKHVVPLVLFNVYSD